MPYALDPHRHVKIWLSRDPNSFLSIPNQNHLIEMRATNQGDQITFVYDSKLLSEKALKELQAFCKEQKIIASDIRTAILPNCRSPQEKNLIKIYEDEIEHLESGGNLEVASYVLRWLKVVYELGVYTGFGVKVDTSKLGKTVEVKQPLLLNLGSIVLEDDIEALGLRNDIMAVVDGSSASTYIHKIQEAIYENCLRKEGDSFFVKFLRVLKANLKKFLPLDSVNSFFTTEMLGYLDQLSQSRTAREVRKKILTLNNDAFVSDMFLYRFLEKNGAFHELSGESQKAFYAKVLRKHYQGKLGFLNWLLLPSETYEEYKVFAKASDDRLLTRKRQEERAELLKLSVMFTSDGVVFALFDDLLYKRDIIEKDLAPYSWSHYGLDKAFISDNTWHFHATQIKARKDDHYDQSWLEVPQAFQAIREKIQTHIDKIQEDLDGCFSFYRNRQRHEKIEVLTAILEYFGNTKIRVVGLKGRLLETLTAPRSEDVFAGFGKNKTKELIDDLNDLIRQAECSNGLIKEGEIRIPEILLAESYDIST